MSSHPRSDLLLLAERNPLRLANLTRESHTIPSNSETYQEFGLISARHLWTVAEHLSAGSNQSKHRKNLRTPHEIAPPRAEIEPMTCFLFLGNIATLCAPSLQCLYCTCCLPACFSEPGDSVWTHRALSTYCTKMY